MAHPCINCGSECYCHGDIDDIVVSKTPVNCAGCECKIEWAGDEWDDDDEDEEPIGYYCTTCEHDQGSRNGGICKMCGMGTIVEYY